MEVDVRGRVHAEDAVSSVVGTILMLAVTVSVFGGLSVVVLREIESNEAAPDADLAFQSDGDRAILVHRGGEAIDLDDGFVLINVAAGELRYDLTDFADQTADGKTWRIGETLCLSGADPPDPARPCLLDGITIVGAAVVAGGRLISDEGERGGDAGPCPLDDTAPTAASPWTVTPDVFSTTTGTVVVTLTASDDCAGVDDAVLPTLFYRVQDGTSPAYASAGAMTNDAPGTFSGTIPAQSWNLLGGDTLQFYAVGLADVNGNVGGATATESEPIEAVTLLSYVSSAPATTGTVGALGPAQDAADGDAATTVTEGGTTTPAGTGGPTKFSGTSAATSGGTSHTNALTSNNQYAILDANDEYVEVSGFDLPSTTDAVTAVVIGFEGYRDTGGTNPTMRLDYKIGAGTVNNGATFGLSATTDTDHTRTLCSTQSGCTSAGLTVAGVESMTARATLVTDQSKNPNIDHVFATVTYTTAAQTTYSLEVRLDFADTEDGASETLEVRYQTAGDTYAIDVWDTTLNAGAGGYSQAGTLSSSGTYATFTHTLASGEFNAGAPRVRLRDLTPTGTTAGTLQLEFARVVTV